MDYLNSLGVYVYEFDLENLKGLSIKSGDDYIILINESLNRKSQQEALVHELLHIELGHLDEYKHLPNSWKEKEVALNMERMEL